MFHWIALLNSDVYPLINMQFNIGQAAFGADMIVIRVPDVSHIVYISRLFITSKIPYPNLTSISTLYTYNRFVDELCLYIIFFRKKLFIHLLVLLKPK